MSLPVALTQALASAAPSAIEVLPRLIAAACAGRRRAAVDELEEFMRCQAFEAAQRIKRDARKNRAPAPLASPADTSRKNPRKRIAKVEIVAEEGNPRLPYPLLPTPE